MIKSRENKMNKKKQCHYICFFFADYVNRTITFLLFQTTNKKKKKTNKELKLKCII